MQSSSRSSFRPVAIWVYAGVIMLLIQVILGGITRLTGSGLSITEWKVITGALPPLDHTQWQKAFDGYKQTQQYQLLNSDFTLHDYQFIYFWEWFHRLWARLVGVVFLVGFAWLLWKQKLKGWMIRPLVALFLLGALQGAVGWIMVASGFVGDAIYVAPAKLALHFVFALCLVAYTFWFALELSVPIEARVARVPLGQVGQTRPVFARRAATLRRWTVVILLLLFFQLIYGALMAGNKAAAVAPTWPRINGSWMPDKVFTLRPLLHDLAGNKITVHFIHRSLAYTIFLAVSIWTIVSLRLEPLPALFRKLRWLPLLLILIQILLGIGSLLTSPGTIPHQWVVFDWLAQLHQITALLFLLTMIGMLYIVTPGRNAVTV
jgi:cytochrome c oxidase assembly protein subunit 15